ncbi:MAG: hypothetical protein ACOC56_07000, partial [Atribacterota bacterium]
DYFPQPVHNYFLLITAETGLVSLFLFLAIIITSIKIILSSKHKEKNMNILEIGILGSIISALIANTVDCTLRFYTIGLLFSVMIGIIGSIWNMTKK